MTTLQSSDAAAMELVVDVADLLLSMGVSAVEVVTVARGLATALSVRPIHVDVLSAVVIASQEATGGLPAHTVLRPVTPRGLNYRVVEQVFALCSHAASGRHDVEETRRELDAIVQQARPQRWWVAMVSAGLVSAGVGFLFGVGPLTLALTFFIGCLGERALALCASAGLTPLLSQAAAALMITGTSVAVAETGRLVGVPIDATPIVVGGIVMLLVGLMFVSAFQDALDEFYVTAGARLLKVVLLTTGIVLGIGAAFALVRVAGLGSTINPDPLPMGPASLTIVGAALIAAAYAWYCRANVQTVVASGVVGALVWLVFLALLRADMHEVPASGFAAVMSGLAGALVARRWQIPSMAIITAGIVTMVPGLRLFNGMLQVVSYPLWTTPFFQGLTTLAIALGIGISIAIGASVGATIGRPLKQRLRTLRSATMSGLFRK